MNFFKKCQKNKIVSLKANVLFDSFLIHFFKKKLELVMTSKVQKLAISFAQCSPEVFILILILILRQKEKPKIKNQRHQSMVIV